MSPGSKEKVVGIVGVPPLAVIRKLNEEGAVIHDLDTPLAAADMEKTAQYLPRVYCAILRTVVLNALHLSLDRLYIDVGPGKCDCALHTAQVLEDFLAIPVTRTRNEDTTPFGTPLCDCRMDLTEKFLRITESVQHAAANPAPPPACVPRAAIWGVPPRDFSILSLFPDTTHVYGWTRCMENKTPANHALEERFDPTVPTVFFAQSFCAKTALAQLLARRHPHGLYVDCDVTAGGSVKAKIQAFLELAGVFQ